MGKAYRKAAQETTISLNELKVVDNNGTQVAEFKGGQFVYDDGTKKTMEEFLGIKTQQPKESESTEN